jgi:hypothetical protein
MAKTAHSEIQSIYSKRESLILNYFWIGFIIYTSAFAISATDQVNYVVCNVFQILGLMLLISASFFLVKLKIEDDYLKIVYLIYLVWTLGVIMRGFLFEYDFIKILLFDAYMGIFLYLTPLILLFPKDLIHIKKLFVVIVIVGAVYVFYDLLFIKDLIVNYDIKNSQNIIEYFSKTLSIPCGFVLLTYIYHSKKMNLFALFVLGLTFLFCIIRARRALALLAIGPIIGSYFVYLFYSNNRALKIIFFILLSITITLGIAYSQTLMKYFSNKSATSWFMSRLSQDTRSEVEEYFYQDMKPSEWIVGKGINGQYYCPGVVEGEGRISVFRRGIETDYLTIILKGGIINLGLLLLIAIPAIIKGLFFSRNLLARASATWILFYLFDLYPAPVTTFTLNYLLVWISIGICYSKSFRNLTDEKIMIFFKNEEKCKELAVKE